MKPDFIELGNPKSPLRIPILYEDRAVLVLDKPAGWMLAPTEWQHTGRNLAAALLSSLAARDFWARSRSLKFLRFVHRLDADTSGIVLFVKSHGAIKPFSQLFESRQIDKTYLSVVEGIPSKTEWTSVAPLAPDPAREGRMRVDRHGGKPAETHFRLLTSVAGRSLVEVHPLTGRTHQIRVHLAQAGHPVVGDLLYGAPSAGAGVRTALPVKDLAREQTNIVRTDTIRPLTGLPPVTRAQPAGAGPRPAFPLGLRAVALAYADPFTRRPVRIQAPTTPFLAAFGFPAH